MTIRAAGELITEAPKKVAIKVLAIDQLFQAILDAHGTETGFLEDLQRRLSGHLAKTKASEEPKAPSEAAKAKADYKRPVGEGLGRTAVPAINI